MNAQVAQYAAEQVASRIGLAVQATCQPGTDPFIDIRPADLHPNDAFSVRFAPGWRSAVAEFIPGAFSAPLIVQMGHAGQQERNTFAIFASALIQRRTQIVFRVNGADLPTTEFDRWPADWNRLELYARTANQVIEKSDTGQMFRMVDDLVIPVFGMLVSLIGTDDPDDAIVGAIEGRSIQALTTRYERKKVNREACIQLKGTACAVCAFDFAHVYGSLGVGYIEVHHVIPVSDLPTDYQVNVATDLEPLCANCHAMVHRSDPPLSIATLRTVIFNNSKQQR